MCRSVPMPRRDRKKRCNYSSWNFLILFDFLKLKLMSFKGQKQMNCKHQLTLGPNLTLRLIRPIHAQARSIQQITRFFLQNIKIFLSYLISLFSGYLSKPFQRLHSNAKHIADLLCIMNYTWEIHQVRYKYKVLILT